MNSYMFNVGARAAGVPLPGIVVSVDVDDAPGPSRFPQSETTDANGVATFRWNTFGDDGSSGGYTARVMLSDSNGNYVTEGQVAANPEADGVSTSTVQWIEMMG